MFVKTALKRDRALTPLEDIFGHKTVRRECSLIKSETQQNFLWKENGKIK